VNEWRGHDEARQVAVEYVRRFLHGKNMTDGLCFRHGVAFKSDVMTLVPCTK
jgi:hypothetical protein